MTEAVESKEQKPVKPEDRITIMVQMPGQDTPSEHEVFMSAGLVRRLAAVVNSLGDMSQMYSDPMVEDVLISEALTPRTDRGKSSKVYTGEDFIMTMDEGERLVEWIRGHILDFFTKTVLKVGTEATNPNSPIQRLTQSLSGLAALAQSNQSAGRSEAKSVT